MRGGISDTKGGKVSNILEITKEPGSKHPFEMITQKPKRRVLQRKRKERTPGANGGMPPTLMH